MRSKTNKYKSKNHWLRHSWPSLIVYIASLAIVLLLFSLLFAVASREDNKQISRIDKTGIETTAVVIDKKDVFEYRTPDDHILVITFTDPEKGEYQVDKQVGESEYNARKVGDQISIKYDRNNPQLVNYEEGSVIRSDIITIIGGIIFAILLLPLAFKFYDSRLYKLLNRKIF